MEPKAIHTPAMTRALTGLRLDRIDSGREFVLDPLAELIWICLTAYATLKRWLRPPDRHLAEW